MPRGSRNTREQLQIRERNGIPFANLEDMYMSGAAVEPLQVAEWQGKSAGNSRSNIVRGAEAVAQAPVNASRYTEKTFTFSTGVVRELNFRMGDGGVLRDLHLDNYIYLLAGECALEENGRSIQLGEGDAVRCHTGALLHGAGDAKIIAWAVTDPRVIDSKSDNSQSDSKVLRRNECKVIESTQWDMNGERYVARAQKDRSRAPADAIRLKIEVLDFEHNVVGVVTSYKGGPTYEAESEFDNYIYITSGAYRYFQDDVEFEAWPGDVIREISGHFHHWIRHEDSSFVVSSSLPLANHA